MWFGLVRFRPEQVCAVTDSVSEQQLSVCSISTEHINVCGPISCLCCILSMLDIEWRVLLFVVCLSEYVILYYTNYLRT